MQSDNEKKLVFSILEYLQSLTTKEGHDSESIEVASQCISSEFGLDLNSAEDKAKYSVAPLSLLEIFSRGIAAPADATSKKVDFGNAVLNEKFEKFLTFLKEKKDFFKNISEGTPEYAQRIERAKAAFLEQQRNTQEPEASQPIDIEKAEAFKLEGNKLLTAKDFNGAVEKYTNAIKYNPQNAIYFSNRAAAYTQLEQHEKAVEDSLQSINVDPNYNKAYSRLGLAYLSLGKYKEAVEQYEIAAKRDPENEAIQDALDEAREKLSGVASSGAAPSMPGGLEGLLNNPDIANLARQFGGGAGGAGGAPNLASLLSNPNLMSMAQNVMSQPGFSEMLSNPNMRAMAQQMMQNPDALNSMMSSMMPPNDQ